MALAARYNNASSGVVHNMDHPFAEGAFRYVAKGKYTAGQRAGQANVNKWFKTGAVFESRFYTEDLKAVDKAQAIIDSFNKAGIIKQAITLNHPEVWNLLNPGDVPGTNYDASKCQKILVEPYIPNFEKFNTNTGATFKQDDTWHLVMQALSHYSYHATGGNCVVCDLQGGICNDEGMVLTDPVILSNDVPGSGYGVTDLGAKGISTFFARHRCNQFCSSGWQQPSHQHAYYVASFGTSMMM